jgi:hypothetical protein
MIAGLPLVLKGPIDPRMIVASRSENREKVHP